MKIHLIAVGKKLPDWINAGYAEFSKRMPPELQINLIDITPSIRNKTTPIEKISKKRVAEFNLLFLPIQNSLCWMKKEKILAALSYPEK